MEHTLKLALIESSPTAKQAIIDLLRTFENNSGIHVEPEFLDWQTARSKLVADSLHGHGPDLVEIASTWLSGFVSMNTLRPFSENELRSIIDPEMYTPAAWKSVQARDNQAWAIPWTIDTRMIFYRRDLLEQLGIDADTAFTSAEATHSTLARINQLDLPCPFVMPVNQTHFPLHITASWIWEVGGNFMRADGRKTRFSEPIAMQAIANCLATYGDAIKPGSYLFNIPESDNAFLSGQAAIALGGNWLLPNIKSPHDNLQVNTETVGYATPTGVPFIGGTQIVVWRTTHQSAYLRELLHFLTSDEVQHNAIQHRFNLSARLDLLENKRRHLPEQAIPVILHNLEHGRPFQAAYLWGMVEQRLSRAIQNIWQQYLHSDTTDPMPIIEQTLVPLAKQLDRTLSSR